MRSVKKAVRWVTQFASAAVGSHRVVRAGGWSGLSGDRGLPTRSGRLLCALALIVLCAQAAPAHADVTISNPTIVPQCRQAPTNATVDGTARSLFIFTISVTVPDRERIDLDTDLIARGINGTYVLLWGAFPMQAIYRNGDGRNSGVYRCAVPGWYFRGDDDGLPPIPQSIWAYARSRSTDPASTTPPNEVRLYLGSVRVTGRGREVLVPVDQYGNSDQFKTPTKAGGVTVEPADPAHYGDGSASATYTFRVKYIDPEGLPPRPNISYYSMQPYSPVDDFDELGPSLRDITTGVETDEFNIPRRIDDPWRFVTPTDPTLPAGVTPHTYRSGVYIVFDDNNDGHALLNHTAGDAGDAISWWTDVTDAPALTRGLDAPRMMVIDTDIPSQVRFRNSNPTAADWANGVIFKYTVRATDHSVAVGIPRFFEFGASVMQSLLTPFSVSPGQKYLNAGRSGGSQVFDPRTRSFVSLPAGLRSYSFFTSNDIQYAVVPAYVSAFGSGYYGGYGWYPGYDWSAGPFDDCRRWFQEPSLNAPKIDPQSPPERVFHPPFQVQVDPQITTEQVQIRGDAVDTVGNPLMLIGIPTAVHGLRTNPTTSVVTDIPLYAQDINRTTPTRLRSTDTIQMRFFYTQSQGAPPTVSELYLYKQDDTGGFAKMAAAPFACRTLQSGTAGMDPLYNTQPDPTHSGAFYAQYGTTFPSPTTSKLDPGIYRYYFRASDGTRAVEWPGDSAGQTSLTTQAGVSHVANTLRINNPPVLQTGGATSSLDPKTGAVNWTFQVTYSDADLDPPSRPYVVFPDPAGTNPDLKLVLQQDPSTTDYGRGAIYRLVTSTDPTVGAFLGRREFYFAFTDNWKTAANPEDGEDVVLKDTTPNPDPTQAPLPVNFYLNSKPFLVQAKVVKEGSSPEADRGALSDNYVFSVVYGDNERDRPYEDPITGVPQVRLYIDGQATNFFLTTQNATPNYAAGVVYSVTVNGRQIGPGSHSFSVEASDFPTDAARRLAAVPVSGTGPFIDEPVLSEGSVSGTPTTVGPPVTGYPQTNFVYRVRYRHQSGKLPTFVRVHVLNPCPAGQSPTELRVVSLRQETHAAGDTVQNQGFLFSNDPAMMPAGDPVPEQVNLQATGTYSYYFEASDGDSVRAYPAADPRLNGPVVAGPILTPQTVEPVRGVNKLPFTFRVLCSHPAGVESTVKLRLLDPDGQPVALDNDGAMTPESPVQANIASPGWVFSRSVTLPSDKTGNYRYSFIATDGSTTVESAMLQGPTTLKVDDPNPSGWEVLPSAGQPGKVTYRVNYKQSQSLAPTISLIVNGNVNNPIPMSQDNPGDLDYSDGATFSRILDRPQGDGPFTYYFVISLAGTTQTYYFPTKDQPDPNNPLVPRDPTNPNNVKPAVGPNIVPVLAVGSQGTVTPTNGNTGTDFTFRVVCRDVDAPEDAKDIHYPRVYVVVGNEKTLMTQGAGDIRAEGVEFTATRKLPAGTLIHSFLADDGFGEVTRLVNVNDNNRPFSGPTVLAATALNLTLSPDSLPLDGMTPIRVSGALNPIIPSAEIRVSYAPAVGDPVVDTVVATSDGRFSSTFVPTRTGAWRVTATLTDDASLGIGGGSEYRDTTVTASEVTLPAGLSLIGLPVVPDNFDLSKIFANPDYQGARWNGTGYDFTSRTKPGTLQPTPGQGFWLLSTQATKAFAVGSALAHNQSKPVAIKRGWNQVANPFLLPIAWSAVNFQAQGGTTTTLTQAAQGSASERKIFDHGWVYDTQQKGYVLLHASVSGARRDVAAWQGLWIKSNVDGSLIFAPPLARTAQMADARSRRQRTESGGWSIRLVASNGTSSDTCNYAGVASEGRAAEMEGIESPPPCLAGYVDLYFTKDANGRRLATDFRTASAGKMSFDCMVETDVLDRPVTVRAADLAGLPKDLNVMLEDVDAGGKSVYLRTSGGYSFNPGESGRRHLRLVVQPRSEGALRVTSIAVGNTRGGKSITFSVSQPSMATVEILTPSGARLRKLSDRRAVDQGMQSLGWDLTRDDGARLPSGIYVVQITATTPEGQTARAVKPIAVVTW